MGEQEKDVQAKENKATPARVIVEIGIGNQPFFMHAHRRIKRGERYIGFDTPEGIRYWTRKPIDEVFRDIREQVRDRVDGEMELLARSGHATKLPSGCADEVVLRNVLSAPHVYIDGGEKRKQVFLDEAARLLKPGAQLHIIEQSGTVEIAIPYIQFLNRDPRFRLEKEWEARQYQLYAVDRSWAQTAVREKPHMSRAEKRWYREEEKRYAYLMERERKIAEELVGQRPEGWHQYPDHWFAMEYTRTCIR